MKLKNLFAILALVFSSAIGVYGQEVVTAHSDDRFATANKEGVYTFTLPKSISTKDVELSAEYYTVYFKVRFDETKNLATLTLNSVEEKNRLVVTRFFISLGLREITYQNKTYPIQDFYTTFLKQVN